MVLALGAEMQEDYREKPVYRCRSGSSKRPTMDAGGSGVRPCQTGRKHRGLQQAQPCDFACAPRRSSADTCCLGRGDRYGSGDVAMDDSWRARGSRRPAAGVGSCHPLASLVARRSIAVDPCAVAKLRHGRQGMQGAEPQAQPPAKRCGLPLAGYADPSAGMGRFGTGQIAAATNQS